MRITFLSFRTVIAANACSTYIKQPKARADRPSPNFNLQLNCWPFIETNCQEIEWELPKVMTLITGCSVFGMALWWLQPGQGIERSNKTDLADFLCERFVKKRTTIRGCRDSVVGVATGLRAARYGVRILAGEDLFVFCKMSTWPASYPVRGGGCFSWLSNRSVRLTTHFHEMKSYLTWRVAKCNKVKWAKQVKLNEVKWSAVLEG